MPFSAAEGNRGKKKKKKVGNPLRGSHLGMGCPNNMPFLYTLHRQFLFSNELNQSTFRVKTLLRDSRYWKLSAWYGSNPWSQGWASNALTTWPMVLLYGLWPLHSMRLIAEICISYRPHRAYIQNSHLQYVTIFLVNSVCCCRHGNISNQLHQTYLAICQACP